MDENTPEGRTCVVVPALNEAVVIGHVVESLRTRFGVVVVIDDGSSDATATVARAAGAAVLRHPVNLGQGAALQTGIAAAARISGVEHVLTFDADGQHDIDDAVNAVRRAAETGVDLVLGSRFLDRRTTVPRWRRVVLRAGVLFTRVTTGLDLTDTHNGMRVLRREAAQALDLRQHGMAHASEILEIAARRRWTYLEVPARVHYTAYSMSKGQPSINALNVMFDLVSSRLRGHPA